MWIETPEGRSMVIVVANQLVTSTAPEELELFDELMEEYLADPRPPEPETKSDDDPLGFGLSEVMIAVTPAAGAIVSAVLTYIMTEVIKTTQEESAKAISAKIKKFFKPDDEVEALTPEQLKHVHQLAETQGRSFGLSKTKAKQLADALAGILAVSA